MLGVVLMGSSKEFFWLWIVIRQWQGIEDHTGYVFDWSPTEWLPCCGGTQFHDWHHSLNRGNYASVFRWIDVVFGTECVPTSKKTN